MSLNSQQTSKTSVTLLKASHSKIRDTRIISNAFPSTVRFSLCIKTHNNSTWQSLLECKNKKTEIKSLFSGINAFKQKEISKNNEVVFQSVSNKVPKYRDSWPLIEIAAREPTLHQEVFLLSVFWSGVSGSSFSDLANNKWRGKNDTLKFPDFWC